MAFSDKKVLEEMKKGDIVIKPFKRENLATSSYDVTLGEYYFREKHTGRYKEKIFNIYSKKDVESIWGTIPRKAKKAKEVFKNFKFEFEGINKENKIIMLNPGETILAHTNEFIGGKNHITTMMKARSSLGRSFIEVCKCAGWGDVGYINRWTMEITNNSRHFAIPLVVGRRIAQIIFFETGELADKNIDYSSTKNSKYQSGLDVSILQKTWTPMEMLPKLWKDRDIK